CKEPGAVLWCPAVLSLSPGAGAQADPSFELRQPQKEMSVMVGETLTLTCTVSEGRPVGPVRWLKDWGSGNETIYDQKEPLTHFTILIRDVRPEDAGTYYCVKFRKTHTGDELYRRGEGTVVSVHSKWGSQPSTTPLRAPQLGPSPACGQAHAAPRPAPSPRSALCLHRDFSISQRGGCSCRASVRLWHGRPSRKLP
uniref:Ig-like domain-containing protein n=1 Tax=Anser cygnoides TaxID=8845 RepID=A0A8B9INK9_ANSCY